MPQRSIYEILLYFFLQKIEKKIYKNLLVNELRQTHTQNAIKEFQMNINAANAAGPFVWRF